MVYVGNQHEHILEVKINNEKIEVFSQKQETDNEYMLFVCKNNKVTAKELYCCPNKKSISKSANDLLMKTEDIYNEEYLYIFCKDLKKVSSNSYKTGNEIFERIDDTCYFKHVSQK